MTLTGVPDVDMALEGTYANLATRAMAFAIDVVVLATLFTMGAAVVERLFGVFARSTVDLSNSPVLYVTCFVAWVLLYSAYPLAVAGRTFGMTVLGLRAVRADGTPLGARRAVVRVVVFPLSFALFGLGF